MYDRFGAPRVDDGLVSTKHLLTHSSAHLSATIINLNLNNNNNIISNNNNNNNNSELETPSLELETNRKVHQQDLKTPPRSPRESQQAYATCLSGSEQKTTSTKTTITTTTTSYQTVITNQQISENIHSRLEPVEARSAAATSQHQQQATTSASASLSGSSLIGKPEPQVEPEPSASQAYQLRALTGNKIEDDQEKKETGHQFRQRLDVDTLSLNLIEETLNYFISCRHRLSQITKTFDDSNALIMLLQEKEEDLEVVGQLGQDLLRRYNELREAYEGQRQELAKFQEELARCREDNQQLKYDLASNKSLLDTFKEEEEQLLEQQNASLRVCNQCQSSTTPADDDGQPFSLRSQAERSLTYLENELYKQMCELKDELIEVREREFRQKLLDQERALQLEMQLRDTELRQNDLEGENETLRDQQRELQQVIQTQSRRFDELLRIFTEYQHEQTRLQQQLTNGSHNISHTFNHQLNESSSSPSLDSQLNSLLFLDQSHFQQPLSDTQQIANHHHNHRNPNHHHHHHQKASTACPTTTTNAVSSQSDHQQNQQIVRPIVRKSSRSNMVTSTSLHEELLESMHKNGQSPVGRLRESDSEDEDGNEDDDEEDFVHQRQQTTTSGHSGSDSGIHTRNISSSTTPVNSCLDTDSELALIGTNNNINKPEVIESNVNNNNNNRLNCLGLSTFTLTTLLLLCLSATFNSSTNSNLAQKLQQINLNQ